MGSESKRRLRAEIRQKRSDLMDLWADDHFDMIKALEIQREMHRLIDRLRELEERD